jgi:hypothetical protein
VCVWLGEDRDESRKVLEYINQLANLEDDNHIMALDRSSPGELYGTICFGITSKNGIGDRNGPTCHSILR